MSISQRPAWAHKRPAPRKAAGKPQPIKDTINWTRNVEPRERYRILYMDRDNQRTERIVELQKVGDVAGTVYFGVMHEGKFKTLRADRIVGVTEQLTKGHEPSITAAPTYATTLPAFPLPNAVFRMPTVAVSKKTWRVDLNLYTCTCPEKRIRFGKGYQPGQLGYVCPHMARAILEHLPANADWPTSLLIFLGSPRLTHIDNLISADTFESLQDMLLCAH